MKVLFVSDDPFSFGLDGDTTYALMLGAAKRSFEIYWCYARELSLDSKGRSQARCRQITVRETTSASQAFTQSETSSVSLKDFGWVWMRQDPPVDEMYLQATWILQVAQADTTVVNDPKGLAVINEHMSVLSFPALTPRTIVTSDAAIIKSFVAECGGTAVLKPIEGFGGLGIFVLRQDDKNLSSIIETSTQAGKRWTMVQEYLPGARVGDKRVLWLDGKIIGAVLRVPPEDDERGNLHIGSVATKSQVDSHDKKICDALTPYFQKHGIIFAGVDVIDGKLTEVNITSPTGLRHLDRLDGIDSASLVWDVLESKKSPAKS